MQFDSLVEEGLCFGVSCFKDWLLVGNRWLCAKLV